MAKPTVYVLSNSEENALNQIFDATLSTTDFEEAMKEASKTGNKVFEVVLRERKA